MDHATTESLVTLLAALLTPTLAGFGIYIAWRQAQTARNKLRLVLFDRRFAIYQTTIETIGAIGAEGYLVETELQQYITGTRGSKWLFNDEVQDYLEHTIIPRITTLLREYAGIQDDEMGGSAANYEVYNDVQNWFAAQLDEVDRLMGPHLTLRE